MRSNRVGKALLIVGLVCIVGGISWITVLSRSDSAVPETRDDLHDGKSLVYRELVVSANSRVTIRYNCVQSNGRLESMILDAESFDKLRTGENATLTPVARSIGENGTLEAYIPEGGQFFLVFKPIYKTQSTQYNRTILEEHRFAYYTARLEDGTRLNAELSLREPNDIVRLRMINQSILDKMLVGWIPPAGYAYAEATGHNQINLTWVVKSSEVFYVLILPISEDWPVPYLLKLYAAKVDGTFPIDFTYDIHVISEGQWILGLIPIIAGTAFIIGVSAVMTSKDSEANL